MSDDSRKLEDPQPAGSTPASKARKSLEERRKIAAQRRAHWMQVEQGYKTKERDAAAKARDRDQRLLGIVAMAAVADDARLAETLAVAVATAMEGPGDAPGAVLKPRDVGHLRRQGGLLDHLMTLSMRSRGEVTDLAPQDAKAQTPQPAALVSKPDAAANPSVAHDDDVPERAYFDSPFHLKRDLDATGAQYMKVGKRPYRLAEGQVQVLAMRALGIQEVESPE